MADKRNALMGEMRATPRNALMGTVADALGAVDRFANMPDKEDPKRKANALLAFLSNGVGVGDLAATADRISYGHDLTRGKGLATQMLPETAGALMAAGPVAAKYPMQAGKLAMGAMNGGADVAMGAERAAMVWHGSPHKFDRFDSSKIGTGEGKQQQGIGAYLAEAQPVAQKYADKEAWKRGMESGYLYKVEVPDEMLSKMANHDLPLASQPQAVRDAIGPMLGDSERQALRDYHGWEDPQHAPFAAVMDALEIARGNNRAATSDVLKRAGIPGIRYLDGGSRGAGTGTSNFVVFPGEENALQILERNGQKLR
jgi:hypothetical protein